MVFPLDGDSLLFLCLFLDSRVTLQCWPSSYTSLQQNETFLNIMVTWKFPAPPPKFFERKTHPIQSCVEFEGPSSKLGWQQVHSHHLTPSPFLILHFKNRSTLQSASEGGPNAKRECQRGWGVPVTLYTGLTPPHTHTPYTTTHHCSAQLSPSSSYQYPWKICPSAFPWGVTAWGGFWGGMPRLPSPLLSLCFSCLHKLLCKSLESLYFLKFCLQGARCIL